MKYRILILCIITGLIIKKTSAGDNVFTVSGSRTFLNGQEFRVIGLRCSNALYTDASTDDLINHFDEYQSYGINTVSVFLMGSRFGNIKGYHEDGTLNHIYTERLAKIIEAADNRGMIILVGCLYWGGSTAKWESWTQNEANYAIANTIHWLSKNNYRNVFVDIDNEGMAMRSAGFDPTLLVKAAKEVDPSFCIATNFSGIPPAEADLGIHFSYQTPDKPYIESEGTPENAPGGYWGKYSRKENYENYINIGVYTDSMKTTQIATTRQFLQNGWGYMLASTWLQCVPPYGPNASPGGTGAKDDPGIRWWLEAIKEMTSEPILQPKKVFGYYQEENGSLCMEAEHYQMKIDRRHLNHVPLHFWEKRNEIDGFSGEAYVVNLPDHRCENCPNAPNSPKDNGGPELIWKIKIANPGNYYIWIRGLSIGGESNGCHIAVDGNFVENGPGTNISGFRPHNAWVWENKHKEYAQAPVIFLKKGLHTIHLLGRDDGFSCDQILLVNSDDCIPENQLPESKFIPSNSKND